MRHSKLFNEIRKNNAEITKQNRERIKAMYDEMRKERECSAETTSEEHRVLESNGQTNEK